ncbi:MoaD/ThiS family protein [bacterium]|nr:MoaD/ThiS family protein [bacterium]
MATVRFTPHLRMHLDCPDTNAAGETVAEVLQHVFRDRPKLAGYLLDDQGAVRKHVTIFVNNETVRDRQRLTDPVGPHDEVFVFQALSGG